MESGPAAPQRTGSPRPSGPYLSGGWAKASPVRPAPLAGPGGAARPVPPRSVSCKHCPAERRPPHCAGAARTTAARKAGVGERGSIPLLPGGGRCLGCTMSDRGEVGRLYHYGAGGSAGSLRGSCHRPGLHINFTLGLRIGDKYRPALSTN